MNLKIDIKQLRINDNLLYVISPLFFVERPTIHKYKQHNVKNVQKGLDFESNSLYFMIRK